MPDTIPPGTEADNSSRVDARRVLFATLSVAGTILAFWLLFEFRNVILILLAAIVLGTAVQPLVEALSRRGPSRAVSAIITYVALAALIIGLAIVVVPMLADQGSSIAAAIPRYYNDVHSLFLQSSSWLVRQLGYQLPGQLSIFGGLATGQPATDAELAARVNESLALAGTAFTALLGVIAVFVLAFYWSLEKDRVIHWLLQFMPVAHRRTAYARITGLEKKLQLFLGAQGILCASIAAAALVAYLIIGLPYALLLAFLAGLMEAVPLVGPLLGAVPALLIALAIDPSKALAVVISTAVIQMLENNLLVPRVMNKVLGANPILTLSAFIILSSLMGIPGAFLAVPIAVTLQWLADRTLDNLEAPPEPPPDQRDRLMVLRYQAQELMRDVRRQMRQDSNVDSQVDKVGDVIESAAGQIDVILADAGDRKEREP